MIVARVGWKSTFALDPSDLLVPNWRSDLHSCAGRVSLRAFPRRVPLCGLFHSACLSLRTFSCRSSTSPGLSTPVASLYRLVRDAPVSSASFPQTLASLCRLFHADRKPHSTGFAALIGYISGLFRTSCLTLTPCPRRSGRSASISGTLGSLYGHIHDARDPAER